MKPITNPSAESFAGDGSPLDEPLSTRRMMLCNLMGLTIAAAAAGPIVADEAPQDDPPDVDPSPMLFELAGSFYEVDPVQRVCNWRDRRKVLADDPVPQPAPVHVERHKYFALNVWRADDVEHCRLCSTCHASGMRPEMSMASEDPALLDMMFCTSVNEDAIARIEALVKGGA